MVALGLVIIYLVPRFFRAVPSPLICVVVLTLVAVVHPMPLRTVADLGRLPSSLPSFVPLDLVGLRPMLGVVTLYAVAMALVGLLESIMTAGVVDDLTDSQSDKCRECLGLGVANIAAGLFGGIAGCGMIGQSVGNVPYGGRGRLSTLVAGAFLLLLMVLLRSWIARVPVAALVAIMMMVSASTFSWSSLRALTHHPRASSAVMLLTVVVVVVTRDLAIGVLAGVLLSGLLFTFKVSRLLKVTSVLDETGDFRTYQVSGQVFFASADALADQFDVRDAVGRVCIDLREAHLWDLTAVRALEGTVAKMRRNGLAVEVIGLNEASATLIDQLREPTGEQVQPASGVM